MQFMITAFDYKDSDAITRRMNAREAHLNRIKPLIAKGNFLSGGAILNEQGKMIGSTLHMDFPSRQNLDDFLKDDPYVKNKVWEQIEINTIKLVPM